MEISLLHPSRGRPDKSRRCTEMWLNRAGVECELIVSVDEDDRFLNQYRARYGSVVVNRNRSAVDAVNRAAEVATGNIMIVLSDDFECPKGWGIKVLNAVMGREDYVLKVHDGTQKYIVTMPILDRKYYNRFGYVYCPDYKHMFVDTHFTHVADCLKRIVWRNDIVFHHAHYSVARQRPDEINKRADATWNEGKRVYLNHVHNGFGMGLNIWDIDRIGRDHIKWLKANLK